mmetsp:Transcript_16531/g.44759  ORF Transcript_16531/g.44759 Transcript_16531/m.44759 type:complete len:268 (+) Transcript_16531:261-1064(+)|eukprot:CAMPEP_0194494094 /NCGR_PEP_ID=MMETSP0253-20130528/12107_1 /TAXON_ID=2966 /ORGANISM="Noctiluca scintillans" /LENGTH=267 /DNA_ID=CAMNT_0039335157 /DNA_START=242 /DNA_END=1045 /DNA_ORIENTATION=-
MPLYTSFAQASPPQSCTPCRRNLFWTEAASCPRCDHAHKNAPPPQHVPRNRGRQCSEDAKTVLRTSTRHRTHLVARTGVQCGPEGLAVSRHPLEPETAHSNATTPSSLSSSPTSATAALHGSPKWSRYTSVATRRLQILPKPRRSPHRNVASTPTRPLAPRGSASAPRTGNTHTAGIHEPFGSSNSNLLSPLLERTTPSPDDWRNDQGRKKLKRSSMTATPSARRKPRFAKDAPAILEALLTNVRDRTLPPVEAGGPHSPSESCALA